MQTLAFTQENGVGWVRFTRPEKIDFAVVEAMLRHAHASKRSGGC